MANRHYPGDLEQMQSLPLGAKITMSRNRIREWYNAHGGDVFVSFSGGKDSTVLLHLVRDMYPDVEAVFVDTGLEYPELRNFVKTFDNVTWLKPAMNFRAVIQKYGYPVISKAVAHAVSVASRNPDGAVYKNLFNPEKRGPYAMHKYEYLIDAPFKTSEKCCNVMKKKPAQTYTKQTGKVPYLGTMACESVARKTQWMKNGCNAYDTETPASKPLSFWTESDILEYITIYIQPEIDDAWRCATEAHGGCRKKARKFIRRIGYRRKAIASVYGEIVQDKKGVYHTTGCERTGCMFCMFGVQCEKAPNRFQKMKETHPKQYEYCMRATDQGGLGLAAVLDYIGVEH